MLEVIEKKIKMSGESSNGDGKRAIATLLNRFFCPNCPIGGKNLHVDEVKRRIESEEFEAICIGVQGMIPVATLFYGADVDWHKVMNDKASCLKHPEKVDGHDYVEDLHEVAQRTFQRRSKKR